MSVGPEHYCFDNCGNRHVGYEYSRSWSAYDNRYRSNFESLEGELLEVETKDVHLLIKPFGSLVVGSKKELI